jgi:hypothetical protein
MIFLHHNQNKSGKIKIVEINLTAKKEKLYSFQNSNRINSRNNWMKLNPAIIKDRSFSGQITFGEKGCRPKAQRNQTLEVKMNMIGKNRILILFVGSNE